MVLSSTADNLSLLAQLEHYTGSLSSQSQQEVCDEVLALADKVQLLIARFMEQEEAVQLKLASVGERIEKMPIEGMQTVGDQTILKIRLAFADIPRIDDLAPPVIPLCPMISNDWTQLLDGQVIELANTTAAASSSSTPPEHSETILAEAKLITDFFHSLAQDYLLAQPGRDKRLGRAVNKLVLSSIRLAGSYLPRVIPEKTSGYRADRDRVLEIIAHLTSFCSDYAFTLETLEASFPGFAKLPPEDQERHLVEKLKEKLLAAGHEELAEGDYKEQRLELFLDRLLGPYKATATGDMLPVYDFLHEYVPTLVEELLEMFLSPGFIAGMMDRVLDPAFTLPELSQSKEVDAVRNAEDKRFLEVISTHLELIAQAVVRIGSCGEKKGSVLSWTVQRLVPLFGGLISSVVDDGLRKCLSSSRVSSKVVIAHSLLWDGEKPALTHLWQEESPTNTRDAVEKAHTKLLSEIYKKIETSGIAAFFLGRPAVKRLMDDCLIRSLGIFRQKEVLNLLFYYYLLPAIGTIIAKAIKPPN